MATKLAEKLREDAYRKTIEEGILSIKVDQKRILELLQEHTEAHKALKQRRK